MTHNTELTPRELRAWGRRRNLHGSLPNLAMKFARKYGECTVLDDQGAVSLRATHKEPDQC